MRFSLDCAKETENGWAPIVPLTFPNQPAGSWLDGDAVASFKRIELTNLREGDNSWIGIRYSYHPGWGSETRKSGAFGIPEDLAGFIALQHPRKNLVLKFNVWAMFQDHGSSSS